MTPPPFVTPHLMRGPKKNNADQQAQREKWFLAGSRILSGMTVERHAIRSAVRDDGRASRDAEWSVRDDTATFCHPALDAGPRAKHCLKPGRVLQAK